MAGMILSDDELARYARHIVLREFGGGGHHNASGIVMQSGMDDAVRRVIERAAALASA